MTTSTFKRTPTTISKEAKDHLVRLVLRWQAEKGSRITMEKALSNLVLSTPPDAPYPTLVKNGNGSKEPAA